MLPPKPWPTDKRPSSHIGDVLRLGISRARMTWWQRLACRIGWHPYPLVLEHHTVSCKRCGRSWTDDGGIF